MGIFTYIATQIVAYAAGVAATSAAIAAAGLTWAVSIVSTGLAMVTSRLINGPGARGGGGIQDQGVRVQLPPATENKIPVVYGRAYQQPIITDAQISADNKTMSYCLVLSERTSTSTFTFNDVYWNDQKLHFDTDGFTVAYSDLQDGTTSTNLAGLVKVYAFNGGSSSTYNVAIAGGAVPGVDAYTLMSTTTNYAMSDLVFAVVQLTYDSGKGVTALPTMTFDISNSISNPGEVWQDYMTNTRYGAGILAANLDTDSATGSTSTSLKSISNQVPTNQFNNDGSTSTQVRYTINGVLNTGDTVKNNIDRINLASSSWTTYDHKEGKWRVVVNRAATAGELASAFEFTDDNIIGEINLSSTSLEDLYNSVEVAFANRNARDQSDYYRASVSSALRNNLEPDNQLRMRLDLVNNGIQAGRIGLIELMQSRYDLVISFTADYSALVCEVGDVVKVTNPIYDFTEKLFRITRVRETEGPQGELAVEITALQYDSAVYTDEQQDDAPDEPLSGIPPIISSSGLPAPTNLTATIVTTTVTDFVQLSVDIPSTSYPVDMVDVYGKPTYTSPSDPYTYITSLVSDQGQWLPGSTATGQVPLITFEPEEYELVAKSVYRNVTSEDSVGQLAGLYYAQVQPSGDADNILLNTTTPSTEFYVASGAAIGTYTQVVADTQLKYVVDSNSSGTLYTSALNIDNTLTWNTYVIDQPTGSTSTFLRNDGQWAIPSGAGGTGTVTWATLGDKTGAAGPSQIGLGYLAGGTSTYSIALGYQAGSINQSSSAIAIGLDSAIQDQGTSAIAIGHNAAGSTQSSYAVSIGYNAGRYSQGFASIAIGAGAGKTNQPANSIILNASAVDLDGTNSGLYIDPIRSTTSTLMLYYNTTTKEITYGTTAGITTWATLGDKTGANGPSSISLGLYAGSTESFNTAIGGYAQSSGAGQSSVALGYGSGSQNQGALSVALGTNAGTYKLGEGAVAIGYKAANGDNIWTASNYSTVIGYEAGYYPGEGSIHIGYRAGNSNKGLQNIGIGHRAGYATTATYSIAIGYYALGQGIGEGKRHIILSAGPTGFTSIPYEGFYVNLVRNSTTTNVLYYNSGTSEITYGDLSSLPVSVSWANITNKTGASGPTSIGLGQNAGGTNTNTIAIGVGAGQTTQGSSSVAIGDTAANINQGSNAVAIGSSAGISNQGTNAIAIGASAASAISQGIGAIAIGKSAGTTAQGDYAIALGFESAVNNQNPYSVAIGYKAGTTSQSTGSIIISAGATALQTATNAGLYISPILPSTSTQVLYYNTATKEVTYGAPTGATTTTWATLADKNNASGPQAIGLGYLAGSTNQSVTATIALGYQAGQINQGQSSIAIGEFAGQNTQTGYSIAIGSYAGQNGQYAHGIAIGYEAGLTNQEQYSIGLGRRAGNLNQGTNAIAIGNNAAENNQGAESIAIGYSSGDLGQGLHAIAIGNSAGRNQGDSSVALGYLAGAGNQADYGIAIGHYAARQVQGQDAIAIGRLAGENNQAANSIIINATGLNLENTTTSGLFIAPIAQSTSSQVLYYNTTTKEVSYGAAASSGITQAQAEDIAIIYAIALGG